MAAGVGANIYEGSDNVANGINAQPTICQKDPKPAYCRNSPFAGSVLCAVNQYDPNQLQLCPTAAGNLALTVAMNNCSCTASPDSSTYQRNLAVWFGGIGGPYVVNAGVTAPEGRCVQMEVSHELSVPQPQLRGDPLGLLYAFQASNVVRCLCANGPSSTALLDGHHVLAVHQLQR